MKKIITFIALLSTTCFAASDSKNVNYRKQVSIDVEGYAIASCLTFQKEPYLKDQGDGWASVIVQRAHGDLDAFLNVAEVVKHEVAKGEMAVIRDESTPGKDFLLPILYCNEIIYAPNVQAAILKSVKTLEPSYRQ